VALRRSVELRYLRHPSLRGRPEPLAPLDGVAVEPRFRRLDGLNQLGGARELVPHLRSARSLWVVAATASYGYAAPRTGRAYGCWIGSGLASESHARLRGGPISRRAAYRLNAPFLRHAEQTVLRRAALVCATSPASRDELAAAGSIDASAIRLLPLPVDTERFVPEPDEQWLERLAEPTLAFVGRASDPRKNVALLLDAFRLVRRELPRARLRLIGEPPRGRLPEGAEAVGAIGALEPELRRASLLVLPSLQEGFGIVAAEALASGVPVIATPSGGPEDLLESSEGGVVLSSFSAAELARSAVDLLRDPAALLEHRRRGRRYVEREHAVPQFRTRLAQLLAEVDAAG
jgi:glycosyltransferase involved in cell wall biosynthesis